MVEESRNVKKHLSDSYKTKAALVLEIILLIFGGGALASGIMIFFVEFSTRFNYYGTGIISSVFYLVIGGLGVASSYNGNFYTLVAILVISLISILPGGTLLYIGIVQYFEDSSINVQVAFVIISKKYYEGFQFYSKKIFFT